MSGEVAAKIDRDAMIHAIDRKGQAIDLAPVWPLLERVLREWEPEGILLFGSRARGEAHQESDWDFPGCGPRFVFGTGRSSRAMAFAKRYGRAC